MRRVFWDSWRRGGDKDNRRGNGNGGYKHNGTNTNTASTASFPPPPSALTMTPTKKLRRLSLPDHSQTWAKTRAPAYEVTISGPLGGTRSVVVHGEGGGGGRIVVVENEKADIGVRGMVQHPGSTPPASGTAV